MSERWMDWDAQIAHLQARLAEVEADNARLREFFKHVTVVGGDVIDCPTVSATLGLCSAHQVRDPNCSMCNVSTGSTVSGGQK